MKLSLDPRKFTVQVDSIDTLWVGKKECFSNERLLRKFSYREGVN